MVKKEEKKNVTAARTKRQTASHSPKFVTFREHREQIYDFNLICAL